MNTQGSSEDHSERIKAHVKVKAEDFLLDVFKVVLGTKRNILPYSDPNKKSKCTFHDHEHDGRKKCNA